MAITVTTEPADYALAKTEVKVGLTTDNLFTNTGAYGQFVIRSQDGLFPVENETITFTFGDTVLVFTFKNTPDDSGLQLQSGTGSPANYGLILTRSFKRNFTLMQTFDISASFDGSDIDITFNAIEKKAFGLFSLTGAVTGLMYTVETDGTDPVRQENFRLLLDVFEEPTLHNNNLDLVAQFDAVPDDAGHATFDISDALKQCVSTPLPNIGTAIDSSNYCQVVDGALRRYHLRYCEQYGATPASKVFKGWPDDDETDTTDYYAWVLNAGINNLSRSAFNTAFVAAYKASTNRKFLTNRGTTLSVTKACKLIFDGLTAGNQTFKASVRMYYTDGTNSTVVKTTYTRGDTVDRMVRFFLGYNDLGLDAAKTSGKTVAYYTVIIYDTSGATQIFETLTINMLSNKKHERYFIFENSLGGLDTLYTYGNFETGIDFTNQLTQHYLQNPADGVFNGEFGSTNARIQRTFEFYSGYVTKAELEYLKDFLYSPNKFMVDGSTLVRVNIPSQDITLFNDRQQLFALKIKLNQAWFEKAL